MLMMNDYLEKVLERMISIQLKGEIKRIKANKTRNGVEL